MNEVKYSQANKVRVTERFLKAKVRMVNMKVGEGVSANYGCRTDFRIFMGIACFNRT